MSSGRMRCQVTRSLLLVVPLLLVPTRDVRAQPQAVEAQPGKTLSLREAMEREAGEPAFFETFIRPKAHLFSHVPVFLSATTVDEMRAIAAAVETTAQLAAYKAAVLSWAPEMARADHGPIGALMGYDFHLGEDGPRLIEINTNAGGAFLNAFLARAQRACCAEMDIPPALPSFEDAAFRMFQNEWIRQRGTGAPGCLGAHGAGMSRHADDVLDADDPAVPGRNRSGGPRLGRGFRRQGRRADRAGA